jgi:hypothetical protein
MALPKADNGKRRASSVLKQEVAIGLEKLETTQSITATSMAVSPQTTSFCIYQFQKEFLRTLLAHCSTTKDLNPQAGGAPVRGLKATPDRFKSGN